MLPPPSSSFLGLRHADRTSSPVYGYHERLDQDRRERENVDRLDDWARDLAGRVGSAGPGTGSFVDVRAFGARGDGTTDDRLAIQAAIDHASGSGLPGVFLPRGTYMVSRAPANQCSLHMRRVRGLTVAGEGWGTVVRMSGSGGGGAWDMFRVYGGARDVTFRDICLDGNYRNLTDLDEQTHLLKLGFGSAPSPGGTDGGVRRVGVLNVSLRDSPGAGLYMIGHGTHRETVFRVLSVDQASGTLETSGSHGATTGQLVTVSARPQGGGRPPAPLSRDAWYHAIVLSTSSLALAASRDDALAGARIALLDAGQGTVLVDVQGNTTRDIYVGGGTRFYNNKRSDFDAQRATRFVRVVGCHLEGGPDSTDQRIDFEGTATTADGPWDYVVMGNTVVQPWWVGTVGVSLWGIGDDAPARRIKFVGNSLVGANVSIQDVEDLDFSDNDVEGHPTAAGPTVGVNSTWLRGRFCNNRIVRPETQQPGRVLNLAGTVSEPVVTSVDVAAGALSVASHALLTGDRVRLTTTGTLPAPLLTGTDYRAIFLSTSSVALAVGPAEARAGVRIPLVSSGTHARLYATGRTDGVLFQGNDLHQGTGDTVVLLGQATRLRYLDNVHHFHHTATDRTGVAVQTVSAEMDMSTFEGNQFLGDPGGGRLQNGISFSAQSGWEIGELSCGRNQFQGVTSQVRFNRSSTERVGRGGVPACIGNQGDGLDFDGLEQVEAVMVGGNRAGAGSYVYGMDGDPAFVAGTGSLAHRRTGAGPGTTLYVRVTGSWHPIA